MLLSHVNLYELIKLYDQYYFSGLNLMEDVMKNLSTYISCFEFDKFEPIATEYEMEEKGMKSFYQRRH